LYPPELIRWERALQKQPDKFYPYVDLRGRMANKIVSCDRCQEVCPYNKKSKATKKNIPKFDPVYRESPALIPLLRLSESEFINHYKDCDLIDNSFSSFRRNIITALGNLMDPVSLKALKDIKDDEFVVRETRDWALEKIKSKRS
jgi:epoxyqueuosine reductase